MTDDVIAEILARFDLVVFERLPEGVFQRVGLAQPPSWFGRLFVDTAPDGPVTIAQAFPFLEHFLDDAERFWREDREDRLRSDPFTMSDPSGGEIALAASAVVVRQRRFLVLERPSEFDARRGELQRARELVLEHENHVRKTGELLIPADAVRNLMRQLATGQLTQEQEQLVARISEQLAGMARSIEALAPLPKGVSRRTRST